MKRENLESAVRGILEAKKCVPQMGKENERNVNLQASYFGGFLKGRKRFLG